MLIIPAIDIKDGRCVRLVKGEEGTETVFSDEPVEVAKRWESAGAGLLHVVDLDGAFNGEPGNFDLVASIAEAVEIPVQVGGGVRNLDTIEKYVRAGVSRVILGTAAFGDREFLSRACRAFPGKVAIGIDTRGGEEGKRRIAVKGWKETIEVDTEGFLNDLKALGVSLIIHTDVDRDGTMEGFDTASVRGFIASSPIPVVASGGISSMGDLERLAGLGESGLAGVILGRAIYTGAIDLKAAVQRFSS